MPNYKTADPTLEIFTENLTDYLDKINDQWIGALIVLLWAYGIRYEELRTLTFYDFSIENDQGEYLVIQAPPVKNRKTDRRALWLSTDTAYFKEILIPYIEARKYPKNQDFKPFPYTRVYAWMKLKKIDPRLSPHVFRHNRLTELSAQYTGDNLTYSDRELQDWAGHSDLRSIKNYRHKVSALTRSVGKKAVIK